MIKVQPRMYTHERISLQTVDGSHHKISDRAESRDRPQVGAFLDNTRRRAGKLSAERRADLDALGMRW
ncbi:helicase associated domain-containing protein [Streptomyces canus]|uniref:helicase associated domain-containing protein n=1 Tax=Streptomyces canus TaxID=58343 RepID=UPI0027D92758|nr:helicase associated domain-containing protein [Streptomyces canus]